MNDRRRETMPMHIRLAIWLSNLASALSRRLQLGGGTTFPGALARWLVPDILRHLTRSLPRGVMILSGTNGKTTTTRMIARMLELEGLRVLHNRAGANLLSGLTAATLAHCDGSGTPQADIALFETDEAALPQALAETTPAIVVIHNLFRDQLDRYGEVDTLAKAWHAALRQLPSTSFVLLNNDDPAVAYLASGLSAKVWGYGLEDTRHATGAAHHVADALFCHQCGTRYSYSAVFYGHIGHYHCPTCGLSRPEPQVQLSKLDLLGIAGSNLTITTPAHETLSIHLPLPGLYNAINGLAAVATGLAMGIKPTSIRQALEEFQAAFGRIEQVRTPTGKTMLIALIKNPVGASETIRMILSTSHHLPQHALHLLIAINDRYADGTDVSWLWDADFEPLAGRVARVVVSGTRAGDMAIRLKYGGVDTSRIHLASDLSFALDQALAALPEGETLFVLPTYTAMLELRTELSRRGWARPFWEA